MDTADKVLADLITKASAGLDSAIEFSKSQLPDVIHQLLLWNILNSVLWQIGSLLLIVLGLYTAYRCVTTDPYTDSSGMITIGSLCVTGLMIFVFFDNFDWLKIWLAPKIYLLEYAAKLLSHK